MLCGGVVFILLFWGNYAILPIKDSVKIKSLQFVENLKKDLRRNNDDYAERLNYTDSLIKHPFKTNNLDQGPLFNYRRKNDEVDVRDQMIDKIMRRVNDAFVSKDMQPRRRAEIITQRHSKDTTVTLVNKFQTIGPLSKQLINKLQTFSIEKKPNDIKPTINERSEIPSTSTTLKTITTVKTTKEQKYEKQNKLEKLKKFLVKNKGLLKDLISSKTVNQVPISVTKKLEQKLTTLSVVELQKVLRMGMKGSRERNMGELPNGELLDMAPAKGGRIHQKRLRGRLCHRHVLIPEGPKYNSKGRIYLPAHNARIRFEATRAPALLLPRCCNCCRKSVLGCE